MYIWMIEGVLYTEVVVKVNGRFCCKTTIIKYDLVKETKIAINMHMGIIV